jgi:DNA-binding NtrC family response regulator
MDVLRNHPWPGNVRELRNVVESTLVLQKGERIDTDALRKSLREQTPLTEERGLPVPLGKSVEQAERELILRALLDIKGNILDLKSLLSEHARTLASTRDASQDSMAVRTPREQSSLSLQEMERKMIEEALERYKGNRRVAARVLNISERTLYRKIKEYGLG